MQQTAVTTDILSTTNYDMFAILTANRDVVPAHVRRLVVEMESRGNFTENDPILVNEHFEVIDGQHRLAAVSQLGLPVFYRVIEGVNINDARAMNILHKSWTTHDYLNSYANEGRRAYRDLKRLVETYENTPVTVILYFAYGSQNSGLGAKFRRGEFEMFDVSAAQDRLDKLTELAELTPAFNAKSMALAFLNALNVDNFDYDRLRNKVERLAQEIRPFQNVTDNLRQLENVYNDGNSVNRFRLF